MSPEDFDAIFQPITGEWYESLKNPEKAQNRVLSKLLSEYGKTQYGQIHQAPEIGSLNEYRAKFPIVNYRQLNPYLTEIQRGNYKAFLPEPLVCWVMTRGSTGKAKVLPTTKTHLEQIFTCGARALINHVIRTKNLTLLTGNILNLNFPSAVHTTTIDGRTVTYGYSSGTYAKLNPMFSTVSILPRQEDIDALGAGITKHDWERRFELAYQQALNANVTATMGVTPMILSFARYVQKHHGKRPKDLWQTQVMFCTSVRKIQYKYAPVLKKYYGQAPITEIYSATEGVFAQQKDDLPFVTPNYDKYLFEVQTNKGIKMLNELKRGEWGKLIVSSCMLPRYDIGDLIEAFGKDYFRVVGRQNSLTLLEHRLYRLLFGWFL